MDEGHLGLCVSRYRVRPSLTAAWQLSALEVKGTQCFDELGLKYPNS